jgi:hypothetical protein
MALSAIRAPDRRQILRAITSGGVARPLAIILWDVTIEAAALCKMAERGQITGAMVEGPLAFDNAIDPEAAEGSSSLEFQLYDAAGEVPDLSAAVREMPALLAGQGEHRITAIGHRVVHGGPDHGAPVLIDVLARLETYPSQGAAGPHHRHRQRPDPSPGSAPAPSARAARSILR